MPKIKKLQRRKKFRTNVNRKRMRDKLKKLPNIECKQIKEAWEVRKSTIRNLEQMGLAYDPNKILKIPKIKQNLLKAKRNNSEEDEESSEEVENKIKKLHVVESLEEEAKWPRAKLFRLPNNEVNFAIYMMDKYGDNYEAMVRDRKNYYQLTACQIRRKIERFKSIPEQYAEYLVQKGEIILDNPTPLKKIKPEILQEPAKNNSDTKLSRRKRKKSKILETVWQEESIIEDESFNNTNKTVGDVETNNFSLNQSNGEKKLQLFSDDENENGNDDNDDE